MSTVHPRPGLPHRSRAYAALCGLLAALAGLAAGHLVAGLLDPVSSPVLAVGSTVIDLTPTPVKEWAVSTFGTADKPILVGSVAAVSLLLAMCAGVVARTRLAAGIGVLLVLSGLAGAAAVLRREAGLLDVVPSLATAVVAIGVLVAGSVHHERRFDAPRVPVRRATSAGSSRRGVLVGGGAVALAAVAMGSAGEWLARSARTVADVVLPRAADPAPPLPPGLEERFAGISPFRTPTEDFYRIDINLTVPAVDVAGHTLRIDGDVARELTFTFDELAAMPLVERDITMTCVSNEVGGEYVGSARWLGVPLADLLERAGVGDTADQILSTAVDGFTISTPLDVALDGRDTLVAIGMNGGPLPREHGFPVRLVTPGIYGFVGSTKWLTRLTLTTYAAEAAYWTERDWATDAPIKTSSRIDVPEPLARLDAGRQVIGGVAWAQQRGIGRVEVRVDGGEWQEARLGPDAGVDYWRQWFLPWEATPGRHLLAVRATDGDGKLQTAARAAPFPEGASGIQEIAVRVE